jgi:hypothetical protein
MKHSAGTWIVVLLLFSLAPANAAIVNVSLAAPRQVGTSERAQVGISVDAQAALLMLTAGGGYTLTCPDTTPLTAQRSLQFMKLKSGYQVSVFVPEVIPTEYIISGWYSWERPSTHHCTFSYTGRAKDGWVSLSGIGMNVSLGGEEAIDGDSVVFPMVKQAPPPPPPPPPLPPGGGIPCLSCTCTPP